MGKLASLLKQSKKVVTILNILFEVWTVSPGGCNNFSIFSVPANVYPVLCLPYVDHRESYDLDHMRVIWESYDLDQTVAKSDANYKQLRQFDLLTVADFRRIV